MAVELIYTGTIVIGIYMKEDLKDKILEQLVKLLHRIERKYKYPNIIIYGDFNINSHWTIKKIENKTNLKWATSNSSIITTGNAEYTSCLPIEDEEEEKKEEKPYRIKILLKLNYYLYPHKSISFWYKFRKF